MTGTRPDARDASGEATRYRVHGRRAFWASRGLGALALAAVCAYSTFTGRGALAVVGALGFALFGAFALYALRQGMRRGPRLTLGADGVDAADLGVGTIPWTDVVHVQAFGSAEAPFVAFHVADPAPYLARMRGGPRRIARLLAAQGLPYFSVNLIGTDRDAHEVVASARRWLPR